MLTAVITGVAGQDGSYLSEYLLSLGYKVIGIARRKSTNLDNDNLKNIINNNSFKLVIGDITDTTFICRILHHYKPHEWYNLAAMSHVGQSFIEPAASLRVNSESVINQLELIRNISPYTRFYQASTSELFGSSICPKNGFNEESTMKPMSPYAISKLSAYWSVINHRKSYNLFACNGILHNHSSPRRGLDFATRKITVGVSKVKLGLEKTLKMGNLNAFRDEGHAKDYCKAMHLMLQQEEPDDFVIATNSGATIEEMLKYVCSLASLNFEEVYEQDQRFMRPSDVPFLLGNSEKAQKKLGWKPEYNWKKLLEEMYENDLSYLSKPSY
jgi:GDPmannose 4,6-dehydratase